MTTSGGESGRGDQPLGARHERGAGRGARNWVRSALAAVGLGGKPKEPPAPATTDRGTLLAEERTRLAFERNFLAAERTLMAWIRTSLSMISFGFTMVKFVEYLEEQRKVSMVGVFGHSYGPPALGLTLITIGTLALVAAVVQHRQTMKRLREQGLVSAWSLALAVASVVAILGVFALGSLVLKY